MLECYQTSKPKIPPKGRQSLYPDPTEGWKTIDSDGNIAALGGGGDSFIYMTSINTHTITSLGSGVGNVQTLPLSNWTDIPSAAKAVLFSIRALSNGTGGDEEGFSSAQLGGVFIPLASGIVSSAGYVGAQGWFPVLTGPNVGIAYTRFSSGFIDDVAMTAVAYIL